MKNEPAFPTNGYSLGLTKREYFAAMAMQAMISRAESDLTFGSICDGATNFADALIAALEEKWWN